MGVWLWGSDAGGVVVVSGMGATVRRVSTALVGDAFDVVAVLGIVAPWVVIAVVVTGMALVVMVVVVFMADFDSVTDIVLSSLLGLLLTLSSQMGMTSGSVAVGGSEGKCGVGVEFDSAEAEGRGMAWGAQVIMGEVIAGEFTTLAGTADEGIIVEGILDDGIMLEGESTLSSLIAGSDLIALSSSISFPTWRYTCIYNYT